MNSTLINADFKVFQPFSGSFQVHEVQLPIERKYMFQVRQYSPSKYSLYFLLMNCDHVHHPLREHEDQMPT